MATADKDNKVTIVVATGDQIDVDSDIFFVWWFCEKDYDDDAVADDDDCYNDDHDWYNGDDNDDDDNVWMDITRGPLLSADPVSWERQDFATLETLALLALSGYVICVMYIYTYKKNLLPVKTGGRVVRLRISVWYS